MQDGHQKYGGNGKNYLQHAVASIETILHDHGCFVLVTQTELVLFCSPFQ